jgi:hypothetical protein
MSRCFGRCAGIWCHCHSPTVLARPVVAMNPMFPFPPLIANQRRLHKRKNRIWAITRGLASCSRAHTYLSLPHQTSQPHCLRSEGAHTSCRSHPCPSPGYSRPLPAQPPAAEAPLPTPLPFPVAAPARLPVTDVAPEAPWIPVVRNSDRFRKQFLRTRHHFANNAHTMLTPPRAFLAPSQPPTLSLLSINSLQTGLVVSTLASTSLGIATNVLSFFFFPVMSRRHSNGLTTPSRLVLNMLPMSASNLSMAPRLS